MVSVSRKSRAGTARAQFLTAVSAAALSIVCGGPVLADDISMDSADWAVDRYATAGFENVDTFEGRLDVLKMTVSPPATPSSFYNWQGYQQRVDVAPGDSYVGGDFWIPDSGWQSGTDTDYVRTGLWGSAMPDETVAGGSYVDSKAVFPIISFTNVDGVGRLEVWDTTANPTGGWVVLEDTAGLIQYGEWNKIDMRLITSDGPTRIEYYFNDTLIYTWNAPEGEDGSIPEQFWAMYLKARNNGVTEFDTYWSRLVAGEIVSGGNGPITGETGTVVVTPSDEPGEQVVIFDGVKVQGSVVANGGEEGASLVFGGETEIEGNVAGGNTNFVFTGPTSIGGNVELDEGSSTSGGTTDEPIEVGGSVAVGEGATMGGNWEVTGDVAVHGVISPGNSIGSVTVGGTLTLGTTPLDENDVEVDNGVYRVEVNALGQSDRISVDGDPGTAILEQTARVTVDGVNGNFGDFIVGYDYTILTATGGITGTFADVVWAEGANYVLLTPMLDYQDDADIAFEGVDTVTLSIERNKASFSDLAETRNQFAVAGAWDSAEDDPGFDGDNDAYQALIRSPDAATARYAYDQLSGEIFASAKSVLIEDSRFVRDAALARLRGALDGEHVAGMNVAPLGYAAPAKAPAAPFPTKAEPMAPPPPTSAFWTQAFGSWGSTDGDGNAASIDRDTGGFFIGADTLLAGWRVGALGGYSRTSFDADAVNSSGDSDNYHVGLYAGTNWDALAFRAGAAYTWNDVSTSRSVGFLGFGDQLDASYDAGTTQIFGELGYRIAVQGATFEPFANLAYVSLHTDGFTEDGGDAALWGASDTTDTTFTTLGLRASTLFAAGGGEVALRGMLGWRHAFGDVTPTQALAFEFGDVFSVAGVPIAEDALVVEAGFDFAVTQSARLGVAYGGQFGDGSTDQSVTGTLSIAF